MITTTDEWEGAFSELSDRLMESLRPNEFLSLDLAGEKSHFIRFNRARVRQAGKVIDSSVKLGLIDHGRSVHTTFPLTGNAAVDLAAALENFSYLRQEIVQLPQDPYLVIPENQGSSREVYPGNLLAPESAVSEILPAVQGLDFTGFYASGEVVRAHHNSVGQKHWFATESFFLNYSLISPSDKAVKSILADRSWHSSRYRGQVHQARDQLKLLDSPIHEVKPGRYRTYLAPAAVADLLGMFSRGGVSEASLRQGGSALAQMRQGKTLSPLFKLRENFSGGNVPRFNDLGEVAPEELPLIVEGKLVNTLVSSRTAAEYGLVSNGAVTREGLRSPEVMPGNLKEEEILKELDTGLYLSNLHYLNWSDLPGGRITGMTRYACFWVENGKIVAPIRDLRFDDSLYTFLGENLLALTEFQEFIPKTGTYQGRSLGGSLMPGLLVEDFTFTL